MRPCNDFSIRFKKREMFPEAISIASACSGCMYGSYPEITVTARFAHAALSRLKLFLNEDKVIMQRFATTEDLIEIAKSHA